MKRSENWRNVFDPQTRFFRGKNENGSWLEPFDPFTWGSPYEEGAAWQHRWNVPHDVPGLIAAMGGDKAFGSGAGEDAHAASDISCGRVRAGDSRDVGDSCAAVRPVYAQQPAGASRALFALRLQAGLTVRSTGCGGVLNGGLLNRELQWR